MTVIFQKRYVIFWIITFAFILRIIGTGKSFQGDEFFSIMDARDLFLIPQALLSDTHPPLYFYILHFWMKISMNETFLRLLSVIPGIGTCVLTYYLGSLVYGEKAGLASALIVSMAPIAVWSSQYIRTYSLAAFFTILSVYFLLRLFREGRVRNSDWIWYVITSAVSIYTFYFSALILIAENIYVVLCGRSKGFFKRWLIAQISIFVLYIPWIPYFIFQRSSYVGHPQMVEKAGFYIGNMHIGAIMRSLAGLAGFDPRMFAKYTVSANTGIKIVGLVLGASAIIIAIFAIIKFFTVRKTKDIKDEYLTLFLFLAIIPFIVAIIIHQFFGIILMSHYFISSFVFMAVFFVTMVIRLLPKKIGAIVFTIVLLLYSSRLMAMYQDREMDFRAARDYIRTAFDNNAVVISPSFGGIFDYYFRDIPKRYYLEDIGSVKHLENDVVVITYPGKLELKESHRRFNNFLVSKGYKSDKPVLCGDLVVERYFTE